MKIQVLGSGCPSCKKMLERTEEAVKEMGIDSKVEYVTDLQKILEMGGLSLPMLVADGKTLISGKVPGIEEIKEKLNEYKKGSEEELLSSECKCSCNENGKCICAENCQCGPECDCAECNCKCECGPECSCGCRS